MADRLRYVVVGAGGIGGLYGGRLAAVAGADVGWLVRSGGSADELRDGGLEVTSPLGDVAIAGTDLDVHEDPKRLAPADVVLVCLKTTQNADLAEVIGPLVDDDTLVVLMQNGLGIEEAVAQALGRGRFAGGLCFVCTLKESTGRIAHLDYGRLVLAPADLAHTALVERVATDFAKAGIDVSVAPDLPTARWRKLVWNVAYNGLCVVLDSKTDELMADPYVRPVIEALMREVQAAARAAGADVSDRFVEQMLEDTEKMTPYDPSTKVDADRGNPLEVDAMFSAPLRAARAAGVATPYLEMLEAQLRFVDARLTSGRSADQ